MMSDLISERYLVPLYIHTVIPEYKENRWIDKLTQSELGILDNLSGNCTVSYLGRKYFVIVLVWHQSIDTTQTFVVERFLFHIKAFLSGLLTHMFLVEYLIYCSFGIVFVNYILSALELSSLVSCAIPFYCNRIQVTN